MEERSEEEGSDLKGHVRFHHRKVEGFRTILVDGAFGGPTPAGKISVVLFHERVPIPRVTVHEVGEDGKLRDERRELREGEDGILRSLEAELVLDVDAAERLRNWLTEQIDNIRKGRLAIEGWDGPETEGDPSDDTHPMGEL